MSAIFMGHHRFSNINPEDIARFGKRCSLAGISFRSRDRNSDSDSDDSDDDDNYENDEVASGQFGASEQPDGGGGDDDESYYSAGLGKSDDESNVDIPASGPSRLNRQSTLKRSVKSHVSVRSRRSFAKRVLRWWKRCYRRYGFRHVIPVLLLIAYSVLGAWTLSAIEQPYLREKQRRERQMDRDVRNETVRRILQWFNRSSDDRASMLFLAERLRAFDVDFKNDTNSTKVEVHWDLWDGLFYVGTIYTTIGYGNVFCETTAGWALTMVFAFFGIPLMLAILNDIGQLLCVWSNTGWSRLKLRFAEVNKSDADVEKGHNQTEEPDENEINPGMPWTLAVVLTLGWLLFCSGLFCLWEDWNYFTSFYFFFISLSTIGTGDVVPFHRKLMVINFLFVIIGLCLVSMTIGVVQQHIEAFLYRMMKMLQKECEALLANSQNVDKQQLLKKIWGKQPWYMRKMMPAFISHANNQRLDDFAGTTITDTAVKLGLIPPIEPSPMRLAPVTSPLPPPPEPEPAPVTPLIPSDPKPAKGPVRMRPISTSELAEDAEEPRPALSRTVSLGRHAHRERRKPAEKKLSASLSNLQPGAKLILPKEPRGTTLEQRQKKLAAALRTRTMMTQTTPMPGASVETQTDVSGKELIIKKETLSNISLISWGDDDELSPSPSPFRPMRVSLTAEPPTQSRESSRRLTADWSGKPLVDVVTQTDLLPPLASWGSSSSTTSSELYESALESKSALPPTPTPAPPSEPTPTTAPPSVPTPTPAPPSMPTPTPALPPTPTTPPISQSSQTVEPMSTGNRSNAETKTSPIDRRNAEMQTETKCSNAEVQCRPVSMVDEEIQTIPWQRLTLHQAPAAGNADADAEVAPVLAAAATARFRSTRPDVLPNDSTSMDEPVSKSTQTSTENRREIEIQTVAEKRANLEMQTDPTAVQSVETQTEAETGSRPPSVGGGETPTDKQTPPPIRSAIRILEQVDNGDGIPIDNTWSYTSWVPQGLDSVPEAEEEEEELDDEALAAALGQQLHAYDGPIGDDEQDAILSQLIEVPEEDEEDEDQEEDAESSGSGVVLPAVTAAATADDETTLDECLSIPTALEVAPKPVVRMVSCQTDLSSMHGSQTAACQTQRVRFAAETPILAVIATQTDDWTSTRRNSFPRDISGKRAEAIIRDINNSRHRWSAWIRGKRQRGASQQRVGVAVQTDAWRSGDVRDIVVQTDDSYLRMATRLNQLKTARTKSLAVVVSPQLRQRLTRLAANAAAAAATAASAQPPTPTPPPSKSVALRRVKK